MAEGFAKALFDPQWRVASAGIETHGLNPKAVQVMAEVGIDISTQRSKLIDTDYLNTSDLVVTLCGDARDRCPVTPASVKKVHWPLPDPAQAGGSEAEQLAVFRQVRDEIKQRLIELKKTMERA
ncbi:arsenate reductase [Secundilactobacillus collinoides DSM 20515 = JCM 1123]|uniref:Arsenate reductase n=2 Tax=Secundilactobacillus collinoides TaxID=33960 RepID=A0A0R2B9Z0_SECCO|nr:arsenate reductase [Secundilactobacillus collinoides DSM 20515 = JCM 1123]